MAPKATDTAVLEYGRPGDPLFAPKRLVGLEARNISAWFGTHKVLERVSLTMEPGTVTALIGPSGCGKSTFLRILNRMHEMVTGASLGGEVLLGSDDIYSPGTRPADVRRKIGMVFQKPNPFPAMSIYDNVASGLKLAGIKVANKDALVEVSLRRAGLWNEVQPPAACTRRRPVRRPAAAAVHRPRAGGLARRPAHGRAVLGTRPDLHQPDRGDHRRTGEPGDDRDRHPQHAAGTAGVAQLRLLPRGGGHAGAHRRGGADRAGVRHRPRTRGPPTTSTAASAEQAGRTGIAAGHRRSRRVWCGCLRRA